VSHHTGENGQKGYSDSSGQSGESGQRRTGPGVRVAKNWGSRRNGAATFPETGVFAPPSPFFKNVYCEREIEILIEQ